MKERYNVLKHIYQNYLILIIKNNKYYTFDEDKLLFNYINKNLNKYEINYIILNNLDIIIKKEYENNNYLTPYHKTDVVMYLFQYLFY